MKERIFFIDLDGKIIENEEYESHIGLAEFIVNNNEKLKKEFEESGYDRQDLFLINHIGYTLGFQKEYEKQLVINKEKSTPELKKTAFDFYNMGYSVYFTNDERIKKRF